MDRIDLLHVDVAYPCAFRAARREKDVALAERYRSGGVLEGHAAVEQVHELDVSIQHRAAVIGCGVPRAAGELAIRRSIVGVIAARWGRPDEKISKRWVRRLERRSLVDRHDIFGGARRLLGTRR